MEAFASRILEIHSTGMWNLFFVDRAIAFAKKNGMTGICFHCNELIDKVVFPTKYFSKEEVFAYNPVRNSITKNYQYYLKAVLERCSHAGLEFYPEVKEISFDSDHLLLKYPQLRNPDGSLCVSNPFWWEFLEAKYREFFELFPSCAGIIVSPGTRESKVTIAANHCSCERCQNTDAFEWYRKLLGSMYRPIQENGKRLIVRDFAYNKKQQDFILKAVQAVSPDIVMSLKKAPHDFYPVAADNPAIGRCSNEWVEFDAWGQFFGLGVFPCSIVDDIHNRLERMQKKGVWGIIVRTDWENMTQASIFNSFNVLNAIALARFAKDLSLSSDDIYSFWAETGLFSPLLADSVDQGCETFQDEKKIAFLRKLMDLGYQVIEKSTYARSMVFNLNGEIFDRLEHAYFLSTELHGRDDWEPGLSKLLYPTDEHIRDAVEEKREGVRVSEQIARLIDDPVRPRFSDRIENYLSFLAVGVVLYARGFELELRTAMYMKRLEAMQDRSAADAVRSTLAEYGPLADEYDACVLDREYPHQILYMLDGDRLRRFKGSVERKLQELHP